MTQKTNLGERSRDEIAKRRETSFKHISSAAADADVPGPEHLEGDSRGADEIPHLMREESQALVIASGSGINSGLDASVRIP